MPQNTTVRTVPTASLTRIQKSRLRQLTRPDGFLICAIRNPHQQDHVHLAEIEGAIIGWAGWIHTGAEPIVGFFVETDFRRRGVGTMLALEAAAYAIKTCQSFQVHNDAATYFRGLLKLVPDEHGHVLFKPERFPAAPFNMAFA